MSIPLLSIVIPTRNREVYCIEAISYILKNDNPDFELVIQDNSDADIIEQYVNSITDNRLVYHRDSERLNSVINMDKAISLASGEYVSMIGDDDCIMPNIFSVAKWMKKHNIDAVSTELMPLFVWNDIKPEINEKLYGSLTTYGSSLTYKRIDTQKELLRFIKSGCVDYLNYNLPKVYHGIVSSSVLNRIHEITGHYIGGLSPDLYLAIATSLLIKEHYTLGFPITISGICNKSTSYDTMKRLDIDKLENAPHFYKRGPYEWSEIVPRVYTNLTIWADSAIHALSEMGRNDLVNNVDASRLRSVFCYRFRFLKSRFPELFHNISYMGILKYRLNYYLYRIKRYSRSLKWKLASQMKYYPCVESWQGVMELYKERIFFL